MFTSHLAFAHSIWKKHITSKSYVIDATCGNGHDALFILQQNPMHLFCIDIQEAALKNTQARVSRFQNFSLHFGCHSSFPMAIDPIDLIVYNLGYLPGGNKGLTTQTETSLTSIENGIKLLNTNGLMSITLYPGHEEGEREEKKVLKHVSILSEKNFRVTSHRWVRASKAPSLLLIEKLL